MSAQVSSPHSGAKPSPSTILEAFSKQLGIVVKAVSPNLSDFDFEQIG